MELPLCIDRVVLGSQAVICLNTTFSTFFFFSFLICLLKINEEHFRSYVDWSTAGAGEGNRVGNVVIEFKTN